MEKFIYFYQHIPSFINPVAFSVGNLSIRWYSLMYIFGFAVVFWLLNIRLKKGEWKLENKLGLSDLMLYSLLGVIVGGRLGYVIFYNFQYFLKNPLEIISPLKNGEFVGIYGMSYFGGLIGFFLTLLIFARKEKIKISNLADFIVPAIPAGYFFGRMGNFLNGELYGRITQKSWGMYFSDATLRHPSQIFEALLEGLVAFLILWPLRNKKRAKNFLLEIYLFNYAVFRFLCEFFRERLSEDVVFNNFSKGQFFSLMLAFLAIILFLRKRQKSSIIKEEIV